MVALFGLFSFWTTIKRNLGGKNSQRKEISKIFEIVNFLKIFAIGLAERRGLIAVLLAITGLLFDKPKLLRKLQLSLLLVGDLLSGTRPKYGISVVLFGLNAFVHPRIFHDVHSQQYVIDCVFLIGI